MMTWPIYIKDVSQVKLDVMNFEALLSMDVALVSTKVIRTYLYVPSLHLTVVLCCPPV